MDTIVETPWGKDSDEEDVVDTTASDEEIIESSEQDSIEEKEIRNNPAKRTTDLLKKVFAK